MLPANSRRKTLGGVPAGSGIIQSHVELLDGRERRSASYLTQHGKRASLNLVRPARLERSILRFSGCLARVEEDFPLLAGLICRQGEIEETHDPR